MAHEIESMFYVGETPWHRLGTKVTGSPTSAEALRLAGLDWTVSTEALLTSRGETVQARATRRSSDGRILGVVGPLWTPLQNSEAFAFFDPFVEAGFASYETAGSLRDGQRIWVLAKLSSDPLVIVPKSDDRIERFVLLSNSHDGTLAVRVGFTPIRVVCANTLAMAHGARQSKLLRVLHHSKIVRSLEEIRSVVDLANHDFAATAEQFRRLAEVRVNADDLARYVRRVFDGAPVDAEVEPVGTKKRDMILEKVTPLFEKGRGNDLPGVRGTLWAAYNAVTEYLSYERGSSRLTTDDTRLDSLWFGDSGRMNARALEVATRMAA